MLQTIHLFFSSLTCVCLMPSILTYLNTSLPAGTHESLKHMLNMCLPHGKHAFTSYLQHVKHAVHACLYYLFNTI
jgi:hypothetical protein